jgi:hypothetical protein
MIISTSLTVTIESYFETQALANDSLAKIRLRHPFLDLVHLTFFQIRAWQEVASEIYLRIPCSHHNQYIKIDKLGGNSLAPTKVFLAAKG